MSKNPNRFYVYMLFDFLGIPRYVGKGHGRRWEQHEQRSDPNNWLKNEFIERTWIVLGEIPKFRVRAHLSEAEAFETEAALIKAIGRFPDGPLVNLTDNRNGPSSETMVRWHAARTAEERRDRMQPAVIASVAARAKLPPEQRKELMAAALAALTPEHHLAAAERLNAGYTREKRQVAKRKALAHTTPEERRDQARKAMATRIANGSPSGFDKLTKAQLSANGAKGASIANKKRTPEEQFAFGRKAGLASAAKRRARERAMSKQLELFPEPPTDDQS